MKYGEHIIENALSSAQELSMKDFDALITLIHPFIKNPDNLDFKTISKMEVLLGKELIHFPTKKEWRKIKLEKINNLYNNE